MVSSSSCLKKLIKTIQIVFNQCTRPFVSNPLVTEETYHTYDRTKPWISIGSNVASSVRYTFCEFSMEVSWRSDTCSSELVFTGYKISRTRPTYQSCAVCVNFSARAAADAT